VCTLEVGSVHSGIGSILAANCISFCSRRIENSQLEMLKIVNIAIDWVYWRTIAFIAYHRRLDVVRCDAFVESFVGFLRSLVVPWRYKCFMGVGGTIFLGSHSNDDTYPGRECEGWMHLEDIKRRCSVYLADRLSHERVSVQLHAREVRW